MTLITSISGIRGTIGGSPGDTLSPVDIVKFVSAFATYTGSVIKGRHRWQRHTMVVGRDARMTGSMVRDIVCGTLNACGYDVVDIGLASTPTTELAVTRFHAVGGIIITASHNPIDWNALKLLNDKGEFLDAEAGKRVIKIAEKGKFTYVDAHDIGHCSYDKKMDLWHIRKVLELPLVDKEAIRKAKFVVCVDGINSVGGVIIPSLLHELGVVYEVRNGEPTGMFAHNPEPLEKNLGDIMGRMREGVNFDLGIVVDPDVDRLAFICEDGTMFGEEYTLVAVADYVLSHCKGGTAVSNLSSSRALRDIAERHGGHYEASAVGEVNVTNKMKEVNAVIGGEGNGGVIYPECHYGRDALVGVALFLSYLAQKGCKASELRASLPNYYMAKNRIELTPTTDVDAILNKVKELYSDQQITDIDGVKIDFPDKWVHLRKSNTEPIIRVYSEAKTPEEADAIAQEIMQVIENMAH